MIEFDLVLLSSGWIAFALLVAYVLLRKKIAIDELIEFLDKYYDNPHIRKRLDKLYKLMKEKYERKKVE